MPQPDVNLLFDFADVLLPDRAPARVAFTRPERIIVAHEIEEVLPALREIWAATQQGRYAAGFVAYEAAPAFDAALAAHRRGDLPLLWFGIFSAPVAAPTHGPPLPTGNNFRLGDWQPATPRSRYNDHLATIRAAIAAGDSYQVNYTLRLRAEFTGDPRAWYEHLHSQSHGRFNAYLDLGKRQIVSMSPELFFAWDGTTLAAKPMKGTARRAARGGGRWPEEDQALAAELVASEKNRAENLMIVDLLRNDLARIAVTGSVRVPRLFALEGYPTVYQLTSTIVAQSRAGATLADIFIALFPCGSITGAPKIKTTEIIKSLEDSPRGVYCGAIGYVTPQGSAVFNVPIRTVLIDAESGVAECGVGGGITWDSTPADEYAETLTKARFLTAAPAEFALLETLLLRRGEYALLARHLERLADAQSAFGFLGKAEQVASALAEHAVQFPRDVRRVRLLAARDGSVTVESVPIDEPPGDWTVPPLNLARVAATLANEPIDRLCRWLYHKTTRRELYEKHTAQHADAFDVLLWNEDGELTEFTRGNLVLRLHGDLLTPPVACGLLPGTLRAELIARGTLREAVIKRDQLARASEVWFINSVRGWVPIEMRPA